MQKRRLWLRVIVGVIVISALSPSFVRAYRVNGPSDAPTLLWRDLVLVNMAAYDLNLPFTNQTLVCWSSPKAGDMILFEVPGETYVAFKRVVAVPGDKIELKNNHLVVNGASFTYQTLDRAGYSLVPEENKLGTVVELERSNEFEHLITYSPEESPLSSFSEVVVPPDHYFVLGDNRDHSNDSRSFGAISRDRILGKLMTMVSSAAKK
jgi:signal peptidase I